MSRVKTQKGDDGPMTLEEYRKFLRRRYGGDTFEDVVRDQESLGLSPAEASRAAQEVELMKAGHSPSEITRRMGTRRGRDG